MRLRWSGVQTKEERGWACNRLVCAGSAGTMLHDKGSFKLGLEQ
jgi:hypothetical protein